MLSTSQRLMKVMGKFYLTACLLFSNLLFISPATAATPPPNQRTVTSSQTGDQRTNTITVNSSQLGFHGPLSFGVNGDTLSGYSFNAQYVPKISDNLALGALVDVGPSTYRLNGTIGLMFPFLGMLKFTAERFSEVLSFNFDSGNIEEKMFQNAYGGRYQFNFNNNIIEDINVGGYYADAPSKFLDPIVFINNNLNEINYRYLAGATSKGFDVGTDIKLTKYTELTGQIYSDYVHYNTIYKDSEYNANGIGGSVGFNQLISSSLYLTAEGSLRKIYDSYNVGLSWLPPSLSKYGFEFAFTAGRLVSHNDTPSSNSAGLKVSYNPVLSGTKESHYELKNPTTINDVVLWTSKPAVRMAQVLAVADQKTEMLSPSITSISPGTGPATGGTELTILGQNFLGTTAVTFDGIPSPSFTVGSSNLITASTPLHAAGKVSVVVTSPAGTAQGSFTFDTITATNPTIKSITPAKGLVGSGADVVINGSNFAEGLKVKFGAENATVKKVTSEEITVTVPKNDGKSESVDVIVTNSDGKEAKLANGFTYENINLGSPAITGVAPNKGSTAGNNSVIIKGTNFVNVATVKFGSIDAVSFKVDSENQLTAIAPAGAAGTVHVTVTTISGDPNLKTSANTAPKISAASAADTYVYGPIVSINPDNAISGTAVVPVTIQDAYSPPVTSVRLVQGATSIEATGKDFSSTSEIKCNFNLSGAATGSWDVVTTENGTDYTLPGGFTVDSPAPTITSLDKTEGPATGGQTVVITGTNLGDISSAATFGGTGATVISRTDTTMTVTTPVHAAGSVDVTVTNPAGSATLPSAYKYVDAPTITSLDKIDGPTTGGQTVVITGTNLDGATTAVTFGGTGATIVSKTATTITVTTPGHAAGSVDVMVTNIAGSAILPGAYKYVATPTVTSVNPNQGPTDGGTKVTIIGTDFTGVTAVNFGTTAAASYTVDNNTHITAYSPGAAGAGTVDVTVTAIGGTSTTSAADQFTYKYIPAVTKIDPSTGIVGTVVTVTGEHFTGATVVKFGDYLSGSFTVKDDTTITAVAPPIVDPKLIYYVKVSNSVGTSTEEKYTNAFVYTSTPPIPIITSLTPTNEQFGKTFNLNINGDNFKVGDVANVASIKIGGVTLTSGFTVLTNNLIAVTVPAFNSGEVNVTVTSLSDITSNAVKFNYYYLLQINGAAGVSIFENNISVSGTQQRIFANDSKNPTLTIVPTNSGYSLNTVTVTDTVYNHSQTISNGGTATFNVGTGVVTTVSLVNGVLSFTNLASNFAITANVVSNTNTVNATGSSSVTTSSIGTGLTVTKVTTVSTQSTGSAQSAFSVLQQASVTSAALQKAIEANNYNEVIGLADDLASLADSAAAYAKQEIVAATTAQNAAALTIARVNAERAAGLAKLAANAKAAAVTAKTKKGPVSVGTRLSGAWGI